MIKHKYLGFFMRIALETAKLSYCKNKQVGCIAVKDNRIISIGYNGTPKGKDNCCEDDIGLTKDEVLHAELNCIGKIANSNESTEKCTLFITCSPCIDCARIIYTSGIKIVYYFEEYKCQKGLYFLRKNGVICTQLRQNEVFKND